MSYILQDSYEESDEDLDEIMLKYNTLPWIEKNSF